MGLSKPMIFQRVHQTEPMDSKFLTTLIIATVLGAVVASLTIKLLGYESNPGVIGGVAGGVAGAVGSILGRGKKPSSEG